MSDNLPPVTGIARKRRADAGVPRRSTLDALYDIFADLTPEAQRGVLEILGVIHRQALRTQKGIECNTTPQPSSE